MTLANPPSHADAAGAPGWRPRTEVELAQQQLSAVSRFNRACAVREEAAAAAARSRELRMDAARSIEVLRRQHAALVARADEQLRASGQLLRSRAERRVVLAHRSEFLVRALQEALEPRGVQVVGRTGNGADAVGLVVAEQPDLVLVEDTLAMVAGLEVIAEIREFSPDTVVAAQTAYGNRVGPLVEAGAATVFTRQTAPHDVARSLLRLVGAA